MLPRLRLDELLGELQVRLSSVIGVRDRVQALLEAVLAVGSDLELQVVLRRIVDAAVTLVDAEYGALGVIGEQGQLAQFITVGMDDETHARIGQLPHGHGILGVLVRDPRPLRLDDLTAHAQAFGLPPHHSPMRTFLGVPIRVRDTVFGNLYLTEKRGGASFDEEDEQIVLALAAAAGVAIANARLYDDVRRRERWRAASAEVSTRLLSGASLEDVLELVARRTRELSGAATCLVALPAAAGSGLLVEAADGEDARRLQGVLLTPDDDLRARVLGQGDGVLLATGGARSVLPGAEVAPEGWLLAVPLGAAGSGRGLVVALGGASGEEPAPSLPEELQTFAAQAALGLELAERRRDAERLVVFEDRDRIARDLHDLVIQRLFATGMQLESASRLVQHPEALGRVRRAVGDLDETIREIRSTIYALHADPGEEPTSLRARLLEVLDAGTEQLGFTPSFRVSGLVDTAVPGDVAEHLLAVLREALSNAARHAAASRVDVSVDVDKALRLQVRDDGSGLTEGGRRSGLAHLAERAQQLGGTFTAGRPPQGPGTALLWSVPLPARS